MSDGAADPKGSLGAENEDIHVVVNQSTESVEKTQKPKRPPAVPLFGSQGLFRFADKLDLVLLL